jgi:DNA polymerase III sliding clamp (beta) subunit (PCNA family)
MKNKHINTIKAIKAVTSTKSNLSFVPFVEIKEGSLVATDCEQYLIIKDDRFNSAETSVIVEGKQFTTVFAKSFDNMMFNEGRVSFGQMNLSKPDKEIVFPELTDYSGEGEVTEWMSITPEALTSVLANADKFMAKNDVRYHLNASQFDVKGNTLDVNSSDGSKLLQRIASCESYFDASVIINRDTVKLLMSLKPESNITIGFKHGDAHTFAVFSFDNITLYSKLVDSRYPDFSKVIDSIDMVKGLIKNVKLALKKVKEIKPFVTGTHLVVRLKFNDTNTSVLSVEGTELATIDLVVNATEIALNYNYFVDVLSSLPEQCDVYYTHERLLFSGDNFKVVIMGMRL